MKIVCRLLLICVAAGFAAATHADESPSAMYSFADIYRMTVGTSAPQVLPAEPQARVAADLRFTPSTEVLFTVTPVPGPERWWLVLAGLAAAAWVAHRRLTRPY